MEDFTDHNDDPAYIAADDPHEPTPFANAVLAFVYAIVIGLALYGLATILGVVK